MVDPSGVTVASEQASMGPRRWCRGMAYPSWNGSAWWNGFNGATTMLSWNGNDGRRGDAPILGFNGATTMVSWNGDIDGPLFVRAWRRTALQWGHDDAVVE